MKTTEIKTVVVEPADIQPLLDKDVAAGFKTKIEEVVEANKELVE